MLIKPFIFLVILGIILSHDKYCPNLEVANEAKDCTKFSTKDHYCCYLHNDFFHVSMCYGMQKNVYNGMKSLFIGGNSYGINCGEEASKPSLDAVTPGTLCGPNSPSSSDDCKWDSTETSSCCYVEFGGLSGCIHLGSKHTGSSSILGFNVKC